MNYESDIGQRTSLIEPARPDPEKRAKWWRRRASPAVAVLLFFVSLYFLTGTYFTKGVSDGDVMAQTAVALAQQHTLVLSPNPGLPQIIAGKNGFYFSKYGLGQPLLAAGLYASGRVFSRLTMPQVEPNLIGHFFIMLLPILATALTVWLVYLWAASMYASRKIGLGLALLYGLGTAAWPYSRVFFSEPVFTLCSFGAAFALWQARRSLSPRTRQRWHFLAGLLLGYALLTKIAALILLPAYLLYLWHSTSQSPGLTRPYPVRPLFSLRSSRAWLAAFIPFFLGLLPGLALILLHNYLRFGSPFNNGYDNEPFSTPLWQGLGGLLFSPGKSLFVYSPVLLALPFALLGFWRKFRAEAWFFGLISATTLVYYSLWWAWEGGWCWGPRFLVPLLPFLILPLGGLLRQSRIWVALLFGLLLPLSIGVQMLGVALDANSYMASINGDTARYVWIIENSPVLDHLGRFAQSANNQIRSLTLDQLGFRPAFGHLISALVILLFLLSGLTLLWSYRRKD